MMCNDARIVLNIKRIFECLFLFSTIKLIHSKSIKKYDECDQFVNLTNCYYFPCLDAHYSCGRDNHLARFSYDFCLLTTEKYFPKLTLDAKFYFNHTNRCTMISLHEQLIEETISEKFSCTHLQTMIFNIHVNCFHNNQRENKMITIIDFCSIICENLQTMIDLFLNLNNNYVNLHQLLTLTGRTCGAQINEPVLHTIPSLLIAICLDRKNARLKHDITNIMFNSRFEPSEYEWL